MPCMIVHVEKLNCSEAMRMTELNVRISEIIYPYIGSTEKVNIFKMY